MNNQTLGERIKYLREDKGIYQKELAAYLHISVGTVSNYESGRHYPNPECLCDIADYFNVTTDYLLGHSDYKSSISDLNNLAISDFTVYEMVNSTLELNKQHQALLINMLKVLKENEKSKKLPG